MKTFWFYFKTMLIAGVTFLSTTDTALAQLNTWSVVGAGCVPTGQTTANSLTFNSAADVSFASGKAGEIILTCPIPDFIDSALGMSIVYRDSDAAGTQVNVQANLRKKDLITGQASNAGALINSDSGPASGPTGYASLGVIIGNPCNGSVFRFNHNRYAYYVQINMKRSATTQSAIFGSVRLSNDLIC